MNKTELQETLLFFAELYKPPTTDLYSMISEQNFRVYLVKALDIPDSSMILTVPKSLVLMKEEYEELFIPATKRYVNLVESFYKPWTSDPTSTVPFANQKGFLMGDPAWHIKFILEELSIEISHSSNIMPDHISIILELAAILVEDEQKFAVFCQSHLDWLHDFVHEIKKVTHSSFYLVMTQLLQEFVTKKILNKEEYLC